MKESKVFRAGEKPKGLASDGTYTKSQIIVVDGGELPQYEPAGPGIANLENTGHAVRILPRYRRKWADHNTGGAKD